MRLKKFAALAFSIITIASVSVPVYAADLNTAEQTIIDTLESNSVPSSYVNQARNYFLLDSVDISTSQAATINTQITTAKAHAGQAGSFQQLTTEQQTLIAQDLAVAGNAIGLTVNYNAANKSVTVTNGSTVVFEAVAGNITIGVTSSNTSTGNNANNNTAGNTTGNTTTNSGGSSTSTNGIIKQTGVDMNAAGIIILACAAVMTGTLLFVKLNSKKKEV